MDVHFETSIVQAHTLPSTHKNCIIVQCPVGTRVCVHMVLTYTQKLILSRWFIETKLKYAKQELAHTKNDR